MPDLRMTEDDMTDDVERDTRALTDAECEAIGGARKDLLTTLAIGEEDGGHMTTMAVGEEDGCGLPFPVLDAKLHS